MAIYTNLPVYEDSYQLLLCLVSFSRSMQKFRSVHIIG